MDDISLQVTSHGHL